MLRLLMLCTLAGAGILCAQAGKTTDWWAFGGDSRRDGWEQRERTFAKEDLKDFRLLWQTRLYNSKPGVDRVLPPVILGDFNGDTDATELAFIAGSDNSVWSFDAVRGHMTWTRHFDVSETKKNCSGSLTSVPVLPAPVMFRGLALRTLPHALYLLTGDGMLRLLNESDGFDMEKPIPFVPAGVAAQALTIAADTVYTSTRAGCGEEAAVWSLDTSDPEAKVKSFNLGANAAGPGAVVLGPGGSVYVQTEHGAFDPPHGKFGGTLLALTKDLTLSQYFVMPAAERLKPGSGMNPTSPVAVTFQGRQLIIAANKDGCLYVLKASSVGTEDHHHYLSKSIVVPALNGEKTHGFWGGLASWQDADGTRYILATVWGPLSGVMRAAVAKTAAPNGSIVALKMELDGDGVPILKPAWVSRDLDSPTPPVIANGIVFALANGKFFGSLKPRKNAHATLFALDGTTGREIYSSKDQIDFPGNLAGLSIANGRVYFETSDNAVQVFGKSLEH